MGLMFRESQEGMPTDATADQLAMADSVWTTKIEGFANWVRKYSLFQYPFITACCGMEYMSGNAAQHDLARWGAEVPRFTPRQSDMLMVVGTVTHKNAPILRRIYDQMAEPRWVVAFGACASTGGFYDNYATVPGIDHIVPVDVYIPGCPPRPEQVMDAVQLLLDKIQAGRAGTLTRSVARSE